MPQHGPSALFFKRKAEFDDDSLSVKGSTRTATYVGVEQRNAGLHVRVEGLIPIGLKSNPGTYLTVLFAPEHIEEKVLFKGEFREGNRFKYKLFEEQVRNYLDKKSSMLFYAKCLIAVDLLTAEEQGILMERFAYYKTVFPG